MWANLCLFQTYYCWIYTHVNLLLFPVDYELVANWNLIRLAPSWLAPTQLPSNSRPNFPIFVCSHNSRECVVLFVSGTWPNLVRKVSELILINVWMLYLISLNPFSKVYVWPLRHFVRIWKDMKEEFFLAIPSLQLTLLWWRPVATGTEMEKAADAADTSVLFFSAGANF